MRTQTTRVLNDSAAPPALYMAFDLGHRKWHVRFSDGAAVRDIELPARDVSRLMLEIGRSRARFGLVEHCPVRSCYEAGLDGFWLHRFLVHHGVVNLVVDSASIEVNRRSRSPKTDRLDVAKLLDLLVRHHTGLKKVWSIVAVPTVDDEDARQIPREINRLRSERNSHRNRIEGLLQTQGLDIRVGSGFDKKLEDLRTWNGSVLPSALKDSLQREFQRLLLVNQQLRQLKAERAARLATPKTKSEKTAVHIMQVRGLGATASWTLATEVFGWRSFDNGKQVGKLSGLTPTPYNSGKSDREQGIDKAGNREIRRLMVQLAWVWLRYQPGSSLARWYRDRFGAGGGRMRKVGIVALARKLIVAIWHYVERGLIPDGVVLKPAK